ncbi:hypothetical protein [Kushneria konosiri]|uniref:Bacteriophage tail tape measure C-terminal domain-containing protein n=1 Tax=Kushneria konosiri TaxID=698828 RepID=A0A2Z2H2W1_9GAMM|nr:hypothetical protein [Kushneria konosiri]ARS51499.1 hypothetical protein B9G99_00110 [Kushneria konosiri]
MASLGQLTLDLVARIGGFTGPLDQAQRHTKVKMTAIASSVKAATASIVGAGTAVAGAGAAIVAFTNHAAESAKTLTNQAALANTSVEEFQRLAYASNTVGVEQDKLADILKDTNDRVGDFLNTGGGEMADFFEKIAPRIGVTAEQFRNLSGPQALQKFYDGLQAANLSQAEMTFYMESVADEATALIPLLRDGGAGFAEMAAEADSLGIVLSEMDIARLNEFRDQFNRLTSIFSSMSNLLAAELAPYLSVLADYIVDASNGADGLREALPGALHNAVAALGPLLDGFYEFQKVDAQFQVAMASMDLAVAEFAQSGYESMDYFIQTAINGINNIIRGINAIPGVDDVELLGSFRESEFFAGIQKQAADARVELDELQQNLDDISSREPPSTIVQRYLGRVQDKMDEGVDLPVRIATGTGSGPIDHDAAEAAQKAADAIQSQLDALDLQAQTVGMTADETQLYKLALEGATDAQLAQARAALETVSAFKQQEQATQDYQQLLGALQTDEEKRTAQLRERLAVLDAMTLSQQEYADVASRIAGAAFSDAPEYQGLDATVGGPLGELDKVDDAQEKLEEWYSTQLEMLDEFRSERADLNAQWDDQERALKEEHEAKLEDIERARQVARMAAGEEFFGNMSDITKTFFGEQSAEYRAAFALEKAYALAKVIMNAPKTASDAYAAMAGIPFVGPALGVAAAGAALAYQTAQISSVQSASLSGMAHDGIDSIPETGSWFLQKGERVTTSETSAKLDKTLDDVQRNQAGGGSGVTINMIEDSSRAGERRQRTGADGSTEVDVFVADIMGDGPRSKAIKTKFGLKAQGA